MTPITPRGSLEASTTPADWIATSVPAPIAMPTSARASAGASLTPSPTIATVWPRRCSSATVRVLVLRQHLGEHLVDAELGADRVGDLPRVAGDHRHAYAAPVQPVDRLARLGADLVLERERAGDLPVAHDVQHRRAARPPAVDRAVELRRRLERRARAAAPARRPPPTSRRRAPRRRARAARGSPRRRECAPSRSRAAATIARASGCSLGASPRRRARAARRRRRRPRPCRPPRARRGSACRSCRTARCRRGACARATTGPGPERRRARPARWRSRSPAGSRGRARAGTRSRAR